MLFIWLLMHSILKDPTVLLNQWPVSALTGVPENAGPITLSLMIGFVAYLLGSILVEPIVSLSCWYCLKIPESAIYFYKDFNPDDVDGIHEFREDLYDFFRNLVIHILGLWSAARACQKQCTIYFHLLEQRERSSGKVVNYKEILERMAINATLFGQASQNRVFQSIRLQVWLELDRTADRLLVGAPRLYDLVDRIKAEAEFRFGVALPLGAIIVLLASELNPWWFLGMIPILWLMFTASRMMGTYARRIIDGWATGVVQPPIVEEIDKIFGTIPSPKDEHLRPATVTSGPEGGPVSGGLSAG
jgi:hypothetical protein